jgi:hypothetical protein
MSELQLNEKKKNALYFCINLRIQKIFNNNFNSICFSVLLYISPLCTYTMKKLHFKTLK